MSDQPPYDVIFNKPKGDGKMTMTGWIDLTNVKNARDLIFIWADIGAELAHNMNQVFKVIDKNIKDDPDYKP